MTSRIVTFLSRLLASVLFFTLAASAQQFTAFSRIEDPPYGILAQLWNDTTSTVYIDSIDVNATVIVPENVVFLEGQDTTKGVLEFGFGFSNIEENQCKASAAILLIDPVNGPYPNTDPNLRVTQQPCTPNGLAYGIPIGPNKWNYTPTNLYALNFCYASACSMNFAALPIPPGHGVTVYGGYYIDPYAFGWKGYAAVNFRGHR